MLYKTLSAPVYGIDARLIEVEVDVAPVKSERISSPPSACPTPPCGESRERIHAARQLLEALQKFK